MSDDAICGRGHGDRVQLTSSIDVFVSALRPADILVFDSLHLASALIKLGENRPVCHAALYCGQGRYRHAGLPAPGKQAVQEADLEERLSRPHQRTVTALRHVGACAGADLSPVLRRSEAYISMATTYAIEELGLLLLPAAVRAYRSYLPRRGPAGIVTRLAESAAGLIAARYRRLARRRAAVDRARALTCSEFVYRCFIEANAALPLDLIDPLVPSGTPGLAVADCVTPRDLWSSPSVHAVAVFHRPPWQEQPENLDGHALRG